MLWHHSVAMVSHFIHNIFQNKYSISVFPFPVFLLPAIHQTRHCDHILTWKRGFRAFKYLWRHRNMKARLSAQNNLWRHRNLKENLPRKSSEIFGNLRKSSVFRIYMGVHDYLPSKLSHRERREANLKWSWYLFLVRWVINRSWFKLLQLELLPQGTNLNMLSCLHHTNRGIIWRNKTHRYGFFNLSGPKPGVLDVFFMGNLHYRLVALC